MVTGNNKKGVIKVSNYFYENEYEIIKEIFKYFQPTHIEFRYWENSTWWFYGVSELFEEVAEGNPIPQYDAIFTNIGNNQHELSIKKILW